jgi:hypothetical protein
MVLDNQEYDLLIFGATPAGLACSIRASRENLKVVLINYFSHIGGMLTNGIGVWDTLYEGRRSPIYDELRQSFLEYYREKYGNNSAQYNDALPGKTGHSNGTFEPKVAEQIINELIKKEKNIHLVTEIYPINADVTDNIINSMEFINKAGNSKINFVATFFVDCSYEGDLLPLLKLPYRIGRESFSEYNEPHAGKIFMRNLNIDNYDKKIDLRRFGRIQSIIFPESTGEGDEKIQAFNLRTILTSDSENKIRNIKSDNYHTDKVKNLDFDSVIPLPNNKICWNRPQLIGIQQKYIEGNWTVRNEVINEHKKAAQNLLYYLQNDYSIPIGVQSYWKEFGLPKDEFDDNGNLPYEIYVREGRRLVGEYVINQYDLMPDFNQIRPPIKYDSIAVTEWYMDTHACSCERTRDSLYEGTMMLHYDTYPGQIALRSLYNRKVKNFLSPVCLSCTHVAWGAIRLEPTWMNIAESVALAVKMCIHERKWIDAIDVDLLQIKLVEQQIMIGFFNDYDIHSDLPHISAIQYFSAKGFFRDYNFKSDELINKYLVEIWIKKCRSIVDKEYGMLESVPEHIKSFSTVSKDFFNKTLKKYGFNQSIYESSDALRYGVVILFLYNLIKSQLLKN